MSNSEKPTSLETANEMYKMAFEMKKYQFSQKHPELSENELHQKTVDYFTTLPKD